jgi:RimJ/RimL family protein N-acetyltransferase/shikimate kinase
VARVLITGVSGAGKTTLLHELARRGHPTVDTDHGGWTRPDGIWDEARMAALLAGSSHLVVSGNVENQGRFYDRFAHVVLLSAPVDVLIDRVQRRTTNAHGSSADQQAEIRHHAQTVESLLRKTATLELSGERPVSELADIVEGLLTSSPAWSPMPTQLVTRRLVLGPWRDDDLDAYTTLVRERDARGPAGRLQPTAEDLHARLRRQQTAIADTGIGLLAVRVDGAFAGYCGLVVGRASIDEPELAYELLRAYHGRGFATEAARAVLEAAARTGRGRLWATVRPWNHPSLRVLDKLGFARTARATSDAFGDIVWLTRAL